MFVKATGAEMRDRILLQVIGEELGVWEFAEFDGLMMSSSNMRKAQT
jgi:hypothetical protein